MILRESGLVGGVWSGADFAVELVVIGVGEELFDEGVCRGDGVDGFGGEERRQTFLPVVMATFDFAFCLWSGSVAEGDAVKPEGFAELGESVWEVGEKEGVIIDIEGEREAVSEEGEGEEMEVGGEVFGGVNTSTGVEAGGIVDDAKKGILTRVSGEPGVRGGIVLPQCAEVADLPAAHWICGLFKTSVWSELVSDGPSANACTVGLKSEAAE